MFIKVLHFNASATKIDSDTGKLFAYIAQQHYIIFF